MSFGVICEINEKNEPGRSQLHMLHLHTSHFPIFRRKRILPFRIRKVYAWAKLRNYRSSHLIHFGHNRDERDKLQIKSHR